MVLSYHIHNYLPSFLAYSLRVHANGNINGKEIIKSKATILPWHNSSKIITSIRSPTFKTTHMCCQEPCTHCLYICFLLIIKTTCVHEHDFLLSLQILVHHLVAHDPQLFLLNCHLSLLEGRLPLLHCLDLHPPSFLLMLSFSGPPSPLL